MLAALRTSRLASLLVALSLGLGLAAPASACAMGMLAPSAPMPESHDAACPANPEMPAPMPDRVPMPQGADCCVAAVSAPLVVERTAPPALGVVAVLPAAVVTPSVVVRGAAPAAAVSPPLRPGSPQILYGCFLT